MDNEQQAEEVIIGFDVKSTTDDSVDASAVGKIVIATDAIFRELHDEFKQNSELLLKARPFRKGSFDIPIDVIVLTTGALACLPILEKMLKFLSEYFRLKRELKGVAPRIEKGKIIIENSHIEVDKIIVNLLEPRNKANQLIAEAFEDIDKDDNITGFKISRKQEQLAKVKKEEFKYYGVLPREIKSKEIQVTEDLRVVGPMFDEKGKWILVRNEKKIPVHIADEGFIRQVLTSGEPFRSGDKLRVELLVQQEYDTTLGDYVDKRYTVQKILRHIIRTETGKLF